MSVIKIAPADPANEEYVKAAKAVVDRANKNQTLKKNAGLDLFYMSPVFVDLSLNYRIKQACLSRYVLKTGIRIQLPEGVHMQITPRSGVFFKSNLHPSMGIIDSSYRGEIIVGLMPVNDRCIGFDSLKESLQVNTTLNIFVDGNSIVVPTITYLSSLLFADMINVVADIDWFHDKSILEYALSLSDDELIDKIKNDVKRLRDDIVRFMVADKESESYASMLAYLVDHLDRSISSYMISSDTRKVIKFSNTRIVQGIFLNYAGIDLTKYEFKYSDFLDDDDFRGENGFGSTGLS